MSNHHQLARWREEHNGKKYFMKEHSYSYPPVFSQDIYETSTYTVITWKSKRNISWKHKFIKKNNAISERTILLWKRRPVDNFTSIHFPFNKIRQTHSKQQLMTILQKISNVFFLNRSIETEEKWFFIWYYRNIYLRNKFTFRFSPECNAMEPKICKLISLFIFIKIPY